MHKSQEGNIKDEPVQEDGASDKKIDSAENREQIADLFYSHKDRLANFIKVKLRSFRAQEDATALSEDILQESMEKIINYVDKNPEIHINDPYLFFRTVAYHTMIDYIRRFKSSDTIPAGSVPMFENVLTRNPSLQDAVLTPEDIRERQEVADFVMGMEGEIKTKNFDRNLLILRMSLEGYEGAEIATVLQNKGYFKEYDLSDEESRTRAANLVHQTFLRTFSLVTDKLKEKLGVKIRR